MSKAPLDYARPRPASEGSAARSLRALCALPLALLAGAMLLPMRLYDLGENIEPVIVFVWLTAAIGCYTAAIACGLAASPSSRFARAGMIVALSLLPALLIRNTLLADWLVFRGIP